jgi:hypothetical protein
MMTTQGISLTLFKSQFDNKTDKRMDLSNFDELEKLLYGLSKQLKKGKKDAELISPAVYEAGTTRANKNVTAWAGWCAVDVDDLTIDDDVKDVVDNWCGDWRYICYSTASSKEHQPKFRIVFPVSRDIGSEEIGHFWHALNTHLDSAGDRQTKDLSRMYYVPATYESAFNFIFSGGSVPIDVDDLLIRYPYVDRAKSGGTFLDRLPPELADAVVQHRKSNIESKNNDVVWSGYADCPFFPKKLALEYRVITGTGWYHKMYQIMVATAANAIKREYPITAQQIAELCRELDVETGNWYENRPLETEADRALEYAYRNC